MSRFEAWLLHLATLLLTLSGVAVAIARYALRHDDPFSAFGAPWEPGALAVHVALTPAFVFAFGLIFRHHVMRKAREGRPEGRRSGIALLATATLTVATGVLLQVSAAEGLRRALVLSHLVAGVVFALAYGAHQRARAIRSSIEERWESDGTASALRTARRRPLTAPATRRDNPLRLR